uniref:PCI domain-containing protein n=1 Tax=Steinernema glaseri TaxID=37863 RepID=A0A1I7Z5T4_9BILA
MCIPTVLYPARLQIKHLKEKAQRCFDAKNYYGALQAYLLIYPRLKKQKKYDALVDCLFKGVMKFFKVDEFASGLHLADFIVEVLAISDETLTRFEKRHGSIKSLLPTGTVCKSDIKTVLKWNRVLGATKVHPIPATELEIELD